MTKEDINNSQHEPGIVFWQRSSIIALIILVASVIAIVVLVRYTVL